MRTIWLSGLLVLLSSVPLFGQVPTAPPLLPADPRMKADILLIVAHPDDETAVGGFLAREIYDEHRSVAILYCNRGTGGGNSVGNEQSNAMGAIREIEARRAAAAFGIANVWFLDGRDTPGQDVFQSLENWQHGARLEEVIRIIRLTRPEVILTWLPHVVAGENHGDHQASGVIATEAFDLAGDPTVFPAQVTTPRERNDINNATEGLHPWQPKKIYYFSDAAHPVEGPGPSFDLGAVSPSKKVPYYRLAIELHLPHKTQGDVSESAEKALASGDFKEFQKWLGTFHLLFGKSVVPCNPKGDIFDEIRGTTAPFVPAPGYRPLEHHGVTVELGGAFEFYREFWHAHGVDNIGPLVKPEIAVAAGSYFYLPLILRNDTKDSVVVSLSVDAPKTWIEQTGRAQYRLGPGDVYPVQTFMRAPAAVTTDVQKIVWKAEVQGKEVGSATIDVSLQEWALPE